MSRTKSKVQLNPISRDKVSLSCQTITTARGVTLQPTKVFEVLPGDSMSIKMEQFNRIEGMPVSSFVQFYNRNVAFYVKNCQVWKPFDAFKTGAPYAFGYQNIVPPKKPFLTPWDLFFLFSHHSGLFTLTTSEDISSQVQDFDDIERLLKNHAYDYILDADGNHPVYGYKFTSQGRCVYKILYALGYRFPNYINPLRSIDPYIQLEMSLLPLMSYLSVLVNYYVPLKWRTYQFVNSMSYLIDPVPQHFEGTGEPETEDMSAWVDSVCRLLCYIYYGDDYFTSSLISPMLLANGGSSHNIIDPLSPDTGSRVHGYTTGESQDSQEPVLQNIEDIDSYSQYLIYALSCVTGQAQLSAMTLNDVKAATLAKFGYKAESADMVPYILEKSDATINVTPVMSMANTYDEATGEGSVVGYKAGNGQGIGKLSGKFRFDSYGTLLFVNSIMPRYFYYNGIRRELLRVTQAEEFDRNYAKLGYQAVAKAELDINVNSPMNTFGFTRKYADYAKGHDDLGGDFIINTANLGLDAFHFGRNIARDSANNEAFSIVTTGRSSSRSAADGAQYDRVFISTASDPIQQWYLFDIKATRQIESTMTVGDADGKVVETKPVGETLNS